LTFARRTNRHCSVYASAEDTVVTLMGDSGWDAARLKYLLISRRGTNRNCRDVSPRDYVQFPTASPIPQKTPPSPSANRQSHQCESSDAAGRPPIQLPNSAELRIQRLGADIPAQNSAGQLVILPGTSDQSFGQTPPSRWREVRRIFRVWKRRAWQMRASDVGTTLAPRNGHGHSYDQVEQHLNDGTGESDLHKTNG
jgi:hypothetical protein